jgi:hypothetical protein
MTARCGMRARSSASRAGWEEGLDVKRFLQPFALAGALGTAGVVVEVT